MKLVCPYDPALIGRLENRTLCVRVTRPEDIVPAAAEVRKRNRLGCVICETDVPLAAITLDTGWRAIPLALVVPFTGRYRDLAGRIEPLRKLNLRVYLPAADLGGARTLASLGISVCLSLDGTADWDAMADLMTYALLGQVPHAPIDPFETIAEGYRASSRSDDWGRIFFDDPSHYLHIDAQGRVATTASDLRDGVFVASDVSQVDSAETRRALMEHASSWRTLFAEDHFCARCASWRICRARVRDGKTEADGCAAFFDEMADVIAQRRGKSGKRDRVWQP